MITRIKRDIPAFPKKISPMKSLLIHVQQQFPGSGFRHLTDVGGIDTLTEHIQLVDGNTLMVIGIILTAMDGNRMD